MDKKGILIYLLVAFGLSYLGMPVLIYLGVLVFKDPNLFNDLAFIAVMWFPALAAWIASKAAPNDTCPAPKVWPLPARWALTIAVAVPGVFLVTHVVLALFGWVEPQWNVGTLMNLINAMMRQPLPPAVAAIAPGVALVGGLVLTVLLGPTLFAALSLGSEFGWRGYLLPRLLPLGRWPAYAVVGLLWIAWCMPCLYPAYAATKRLPEFWRMLPYFILMAVVLSAVLGEIRRQTSHIGLAAVFLGCFYAQAGEGIWQYLFPISVEPWTGPFGVISIILWAIVALLLAFRPQPGAERATSPESS